MSRRPSIAFDFDDVLCDTTRGFLAWHNSVFGVAPAFDETVGGDDLFVLLGITEAEETRRWAQYFQTDQFFGIRPADPTIATLESLRAQWDLLMLSARTPIFRSSAVEWIERNLSGVFTRALFSSDFCADRHAKGPICRELGAGYLVDDNPRCIQSCKGTGVQGIVFDQPWNRGARAARISELSDLLNML
jgi:5'(3')-deoxyribonucleotidase